jgi:hypothetical protein
MGRTRDVSKILTSNTSILTLASASTTYQTKSTAGLTLINTTSFSAVSSVSLATDTFTSTYDNYKILFQSETSGTNATNVRFRTSGSDNTTSNYNMQRITADHTSLSGFEQNAQNIANIGSNNGGATAICFIMDIFRPKLATPTQARIEVINGLDSRVEIYNAYFTASTAFDSISFILNSAGTFTGTYSVYGYNK